MTGSGWFDYLNAEAAELWTLRTIEINLERLGYPRQQQVDA